jgi:hypothetical protein
MKWFLTALALIGTGTTIVSGVLAAPVMAGDREPAMSGAMRVIEKVGPSIAKAARDGVVAWGVGKGLDKLTPESKPSPSPSPSPTRPENYRDGNSSGGRSNGESKGGLHSKHGM